MRTRYTAAASLMSFGEVLYRFRTNQHRTQAALARAAALSRAYISSLENSRVPPPSAGALAKILDALHLSEGDAAALRKAAELDIGTEICFGTKLPVHIRAVAAQLKVAAVRIPPATADRLARVIEEYAMQ